VAALVFLALNNVELAIDDDELVERVTAVAAARADKADTIEFLRRRAT